VPDPRLDRLADVAKSAAAVPTRLTFVDIAGLVRGASKGEGLGNQFLAHIREVDAVAYVLRCFEDADVTHVEGRVDPIADAEIVETELMLADLDSLERRREPLAKRAQVGDKEAKAQLVLIDRALELLRAGKPARLARVGAEEDRLWRPMQLLTAKPVLYVCNVEEASIGGNALTRKVQERATAEGAGCVVISAKIEAELAGLEPEERAYYLEHLGLKEPGLNALIREGYLILDLITFFTAGPKQARAWTVTAGSKAPKAAGAIHTDFEKGFIRAETIAYADYVGLGGEIPAKQAGKMRLEGKDYVVQDGDVMLFRFAN
jgi:GTP-binding protein YchF